MHQRSRPRTWPWCQIVVIRDPAANHRPCTPLELLFDLCFIVAASALVVELHHELVEGHAVRGALLYVLLFLPICWAWMLFSWFAAAYDNDDVIFRVLALGQMAGILALTTTIPAAFDGNLTSFAAGYALMRVPLVIKWIRAARSRTAEHRYAVRSAVGLSVCQLLWLSVVLVPPTAQAVLILAVLGCEFAVPPWATAAARRQVFHARHITERFGLFTMIMIGESIFATTIALEHALDLDVTWSMLVIGTATLLSAFCVWWLYFDVLDGRPLTLDRSRTLRWGHGHLFAFCAIGAMGAAADLAIQVQAESLVFDLPMRLAVSLPAAASVLALAWIRALSEHDSRFHTASRVIGASTIVIVGYAAGAHGPVAATTAVAAVMLLLAATETVTQGLHVRRRTAAAPRRRQAGARRR